MMKNQCSVCRRNRIIYLIFCNIILLMYLTQAFIIYGEISHEKANGSYYNKLDLIILRHYDNSDITEDMTVALHEIGHRIWYEYMTEEQREQWRELYDNSTIFISAYAKTDAEEDFAESFAHSARVSFYPNPGMEAVKYNFIYNMTDKYR